MSCYQKYTTRTTSIATKSIPTIALTQFTLKCLIDEIKLTNELEGISSTRHEINQVLNTYAISRFNLDKLPECT